MFLNAGLLLFASTISQLVSATSASSLLQRRSIGFLESRQGVSSQECSTLCDSFSTVVKSCTTVPCVCNTAVAAGVQACVNCAISDDPTPTIISDAEGVINDFEEICSTVAGVPTVTLPGGSIIATTASGDANGSPTISIPLPSSTIIVDPVTVTEITSSPAIVQSTIMPGTTNDALPTAKSSLPGGLVNSRGTNAYNEKLPALITFGALLGVVLAL